MKEEIKLLEAICAEYGIPLPLNIIDDGNLHRYKDDGRLSKSGANWYRITPEDGRVNVGSWKLTDSKGITRFTSQPSEVGQDAIERRKRQQEKEKRERREQWKRVADRAKAVWETLDQSGRSAYVERKGIKPIGIRYAKGVPGKAFGFEGNRKVHGIVIPMYRVMPDKTLDLHNLQIINDDGGRWFMKGGRTQGVIHILGSLDGAKRVILCEGWATGVSIHMATDLPVAVAFTAGNLLDGGRALRRLVGDLPITLAADDDRFTVLPSGRQDNAGRRYGKPAALAIDASLVFPRFPEGTDGLKPTDFNDLHQIAGLDAVRDQILGDRDPPQPREPDDPGDGNGGSGGGRDGGGDNGGGGDGGDDDRYQILKRIDDIDILLRYFVVIHGTDMVWDDLNRRTMKASHLGLSAPESYKLWRKSPHRRIVDVSDLVFDPSMSHDPSRQINIFRGFPLRPKPGDHSRILSLLYRICGENDGLFDWVLKWLAYPLQHPGAKMKTSLVVHGLEGTGKNKFFEEIMGSIYGEYAITIGQSQIESDFNEWMSGKLWIVADEVVSRQERAHIKGKLKALITGRVVQINGKNKSVREEANHANFVFLSNEDIPILLGGESDRRYTVIRADDVLPPSEARAIDVEAATGGVESFYHYLLNYDLDGFDEHTKPFQTDAREELIEQSMQSHELFLSKWLSGEMEATLPVSPCIVDDLYRAYVFWCQEWGEKYVTPRKTFSSKLKRYCQIQRLRYRNDRFQVCFPPGVRTDRDWRIMADDFEQAVMEYVK